jgi:hypothetical protein
MKLTAEVRLACSRHAAFAAYRDQINRVLEFLPNVRTVEVKQRDEQGPIVHQSREWYGGGEVPAAVRGIVRQSMLGWTDHSKWDAIGLLCDWRTESHAFPDGVRCRGRTAFLDGPEGHTLVEVLGAVEVDARRLPGVPGFLAASVGRSVEEFLVGRIRANLAETAQWFDKYQSSLLEAH